MPSLASYFYEAVHAIRLFDKHMALSSAARHGDVEKLRALLEAGADLHFLEDAALREAVYWGEIEAVRFLIAAGADVHADNEDALRQGTKENRPAIVKLLLEAGAGTRVEQDEMLHYARALKYVEVATVIQDWIATHPTSPQPPRPT